MRMTKFQLYLLETNSGIDIYERRKVVCGEPKAKTHQLRIYLEGKPQNPHGDLNTIRLKTNQPPRRLRYLRGNNAKAEYRN